jgi:acyl-CoA synthetase (AMP-forming)/AMP-acid ligase II
MIDLDLAAIIYTSGSTGAPRGVMLSHLNLTANSDSIVAFLGLTRDDRCMVVLPFCYIYALSVLHTHIAVGGSVVIDNRVAFPNAIVGAMQHHGVTGLAGVPSTYAMLVHRSALGRSALPALRYVTQSGGAMPPALVRELRRAVPNAQFFAMYGITEAAGRLAYLEPSDLDRHLGSIGRAVPNVELRVVTENGRTAAAREVGELVARGSNISRGYWNAPDETAAAFGPLGYRTGDLGYADEDGFLYLIGRRHDMLKIGGYRVGAVEIESALCEHAAVHEAAVVAAAHPLLGEAPVAFVAWRGEREPAESDLMAFCRKRLPDYKVPLRIEILPELPKTSTGKIDKPMLRSRAAQMSFELPALDGPAHEAPAAPAG